MTKFVALVFSFFLMTSPNKIDFTHIPTTDTTTVTTTEKANIQMALLLDTSGSMDGLIDQAKSQLWKMVNNLATSKKNGMAPNIEIALYHFGNDGNAAEKGYVKQIVGLTSDLDLVSEKLFELKTNGGEEYCGWAIKSAVSELSWSKSNDDLKIIVIAGNEPFNQGPVDYKTSCRTSIENGIIINTIHCGDYQKGINQFWKDGADLTDGQYLNINQDDQITHVPTPFDDKILELNKELNETYIGFGQQGKAKAERQMVQDANASTYGAANARERASFKSSASYNNAEWDLVDAVEADDSIMEEMEPEALPEEMKEMNTAEQKAHIEKMSEKRKMLQVEISLYNQKAEDFIAKERKDNAEQLTLDNVMIKAINKQAADKNFEFE